MNKLRKPIDPDIARDAAIDLSHLVKKTAYDDHVAALEEKWKLPFSNLPFHVMRHNEKGEEVLDPTPIEIPLEIKKGQSLDQKLSELLRYQLDALAQQQGQETAEEALDLDPDEDDDILTPYERQGLVQEMVDEEPATGNDDDSAVEQPAGPTATPKVEGPAGDAAGKK